MLAFGEVCERLKREVPELRQILKEESPAFLREQGWGANRPLCCANAVITMNFWLRDSYSQRMKKQADPEVAERLQRFTRDLRGGLAAGVCEACAKGRIKRAVGV